jgi:hypothetical protein
MATTDAHRLAGDGELPVVQPTQFGFVMNLNTAKTLSPCRPPCSRSPTR